jgi:pimeloyl-ACP methyl ester carboxylesterase
MCVCAAALACPAFAQIAFGPCPETNNFACGRLVVPLDHGGQTPGTLTLAIRRHRAPVGEGRVAVIALAGGPGQAADPFASDFAELLGPIIATRDLIVFDQRGTGDSHQLKCKALNRPSVNETAGHAITRCADELGNAREFFTTAQSVADIEAIRVAGGYEKLVLYGTSYGTKVAERYAQEYPGQVQALILDSVVPPNGPDQLSRTTFAAIPRVLWQLCDFHQCAGITRNPTRDLARLVRRMGRHGLRARVINGEGHPHTVLITSDDLLEILIAGDLEPTLRAEFPAAVHAALHGDTALLGRMFAHAASEPEESSEALSLPLYYATTCEEEAFPWLRSSSTKQRLREARARIDAIDAASFSPFTPANAFDVSDIPQCAYWPFASQSPETDDAPLPAVPTLIFSGADDLRTPTANARQVAAEIPGSHLLVVPNTGHSVLGSDPSSCSAHALQAFFAAKPILKCKDGPEPALLRPTPLAPRRLASVPPAKRFSGLAGRTLEAVVLSMRDLSRQLTLEGARELSVGSELTLQVGGLRSGWAEYSPSALRLHDYSYIPGVDISGTVTIGSAVLQITGSAAAGGRLRLGPHQRLAGSLGGVAVDLSNFDTSVASASIARAAKITTTRWR